MNKKSSLPTRLLKYLLLIFGVYILLGFLLLFATENPNGWLGERGSLGSLFNVISALFAGFAMAGVIYTIFQQQDFIERSFQSSKLQSFENAFFQMLTLRTSLLEHAAFTYKKHFTRTENTTDQDGGGGTTFTVNGYTEEAIKGYLGIKKIYSEIMLHVEDFATHGLPSYVNEEPYHSWQEIHKTQFKESIKKRFKFLYSEYGGAKQYLNSFLSIVDHVKHSSLLTSCEERKRYMFLLRSYMTIEECSILFHFMLTVREFTNYRDELYNYRFFEDFLDWANPKFTTDVFKGFYQSNDRIEFE